MYVEHNLSKADFFKRVLFLHRDQRFRLDTRDFWSWNIIKDFLSLTIFKNEEEKGNDSTRIDFFKAKNKWYTYLYIIYDIYIIYYLANIYWIIKVFR